jgi:hypothetical protein
MRVTMQRLVLIAAAATAVACQDDPQEIVAPRVSAATTLEATDGPVVRITSPGNGKVVARGTGRAGAGSLTGGSAFTIIVETVTKDAADVPANESTNIRNTALLGGANPNLPGFAVSIDADLVAPDGTVIPKNTNLANLFNTLGTDDSPGDGVTIWAGWHFLESFGEGIEAFTITASVRDAQGRIGTDVRKVQITNQPAAGQLLTPAPTAVGGDGVADFNGPEVLFTGPRNLSSLATGTPTAGSFVFFQVSAVDRTGAGIGLNENGEGITNPVGLIRDGSQLAAGGVNRNFPGLSFTFDVPFRTPGGVVFPAGHNLAPLFDIAGSTRDAVSGRVFVTTSWVVGGSFVVPEGKRSVTVTTRVTDNAGKTGVATRIFGISPIAEGQLLTPRP